MGSSIHILLLFKLYILNFILASSDAIILNSVEIEDELLEMPTSSMFLTMTQSPNPILNEINLLTFSSNSEKAMVIVEALEAHSLLTQKSIQEFLTLMGMQFKAFWISNQIHINEASPSLIMSLAESFPGDIATMQKELVLPLFTVIDEGEGIRPDADGIEWGLKSMGAPAAWNNGMFGQGCNVAVLDTGIRSTHQEFQQTQVDWYDAISSTTSPSDQVGHGTHVCGTIAGQSVGMAPSVSLLVIKVCDASGCSQNAMLDGAQHASCPDTNCDNIPQVASCSWGGGGGDDFFQSSVNTWRSLGIVPVFAIGNEGPACSSAGSPGDYKKVIGVGAYDKSNSLASFSSRGPDTAGDNTKGNLKPNICAPGSNINSASYTSDNGYRVLSGTSMATPHVSGMAALLMSNGNSMSYDNVLQTIIASCTTDSLQTSGASCGGVSDDSFPNFFFGQGQPSCANAVQFMKQQKQQQQIAQGFEDFDTEESETENIAAEEFDDFDHFNTDASILKIVIEKPAVLEAESLETLEDDDSIN